MTHEKHVNYRVIGFSACLATASQEYEATLAHAVTVELTNTYRSLEDMYVITAIDNDYFFQGDEVKENFNEPKKEVRTSHYSKEAEGNLLAKSLAIEGSQSRFNPVTLITSLKAGEANYKNSTSGHAYFHEPFNKARDYLIRS